MEKKKYVKPESHIIRFRYEDIVVASTGDDTNYANNFGDDGVFGNSVNSILKIDEASGNKAEGGSDSAGSAGGDAGIFGDKE